MDLQIFRSYMFTAFSTMSFKEAQKSGPFIELLYAMEAYLVGKAIHEANNMIEEEEEGLSECCGAMILLGDFCSGCKEHC